MAVRIIESAANPLLKEYRKLKDNRRHRQRLQKIVLEGPNLIEAAIQAGFNPEILIVTPRYHLDKIDFWAEGCPDQTEIVEISDQLFATIADTQTPQAVAAIVTLGALNSNPLPDHDFDLVLILDHLQDPGNMGTIVRTAAAAGVDAVYYTRGSVDPFSPKALRSSAGAIFSLIPKQIEDDQLFIEHLKENKFQIIGTCAHADTEYWTCPYRKPTALIIGNEAQGISERFTGEADFNISIPLSNNLESLNAAVAAAVILFEIKRMRHTLS